MDALNRFSQRRPKTCALLLGVAANAAWAGLGLVWASISPAEHSLTDSRAFWWAMGVLPSTAVLVFLAARRAGAVRSALERDRASAKQGAEQAVDGARAEERRARVRVDALRTILVATREELQLTVVLRDALIANLPQRDASIRFRWNVSGTAIAHDGAPMAVGPVECKVSGNDYLYELPPAECSPDLVRAILRFRPGGWFPHVVLRDVVVQVGDKDYRGSCQSFLVVTEIPPEKADSTTPGGPAKSPMTDAIPPVNYELATIAPRQYRLRTWKRLGDAFEYLGNVWARDGSVPPVDMEFLRVLHSEVTASRMSLGRIPVHEDDPEFYEDALVSMWHRAVDGKATLERYKDYLAKVVPAIRSREDGSAER